jgi:hypothetical protein
MFPEVPGKGNQLFFNQSIQEEKSPYIIQYKVFEERLKRQEKNIKRNKSMARYRTKKSNDEEDYLNIAKNIVNKK